MAPIGLAIAGAGFFVKHYHLPALAECDTFSLKAIYSRTLDSARKTADLVPKGDVMLDLYAADADEGKGFDDMLRRDDITAIIMALPIINQPKYIQAALSAGKHVLSEKPIGPDVATSQKLLEHYRQVSSNHSVTWAVAENYRFAPRNTFAAEEARKLGRVTSFVFHFAYPTSPDSWMVGTEWRKHPEHQGGLLFDGGVHMAAVTRYILGPEVKLESVRAFTTQLQKHTLPVDTVNAIMQASSGVIGHWRMSAGAQQPEFDFIVEFEKGTIKFMNDTVSIHPLHGESQVKEYPPMFEDWGVNEEIKAWGHALIDGKVNPLQTPEEALADVEVLEKMLDSGRNNGSLEEYKLQ